MSVHKTRPGRNGAWAARGPQNLQEKLAATSTLTATACILAQNVSVIRGERSIGSKILDAAEKTRGRRIPELVCAQKGITGGGRLLQKRAISETRSKSAEPDLVNVQYRVCYSHHPHHSFYIMYAHDVCAVGNRYRHCGSGSLKAILRAIVRNDLTE